jgi:UDP-N-acetyl-2-amino-2-deoxyglucuronate dehydrogenase
MEKIRFCLVGCGRIAERHFEAISQLDTAEIVGVSDIDPNKLSAVATRFHINHTYLDYKDMLRKQTPDALLICTPSGLHPEMGVYAANKKIHIVTEKPMGTNLKQVDELINACNKNHVNLFVVKQKRLSPPIQKLKKAIEKGRFGRIFSVNMTVRWNNSQSFYDMSNWRGTWQMDGGAFLNQASHYFDLLRWLIGPVKSVMALTATVNHQIEVEDIGAGIIEFQNGCIGSVEVTMNTYPKNLEGSITVMGEFGTVKIGGISVNKIEHWEFMDYDEEDEHIDNSVQTISSYGHLGFLANVVDVLLGRAKPIINGDEARKTLEIILAMYKSAQTGKKISVETSA